MSCNVAFIGLGVMGYPMAGYISKGGHNVTVFNRTKSKAEKWTSEFKGKMAETPAEAAKDAEYIFTCVGNDNDLREVTLGDKGLFKTAKKNSIYIDNTTASANIARELYKEAKTKGFDYGSIARSITTFKSKTAVFSHGPGWPPGHSSWTG